MNSQIRSKHDTPYEGNPKEYMNQNYILNYIYIITHNNDYYLVPFKPYDSHLYLFVFIKHREMVSTIISYG